MAEVDAIFRKRDDRHFDSSHCYAANGLIMIDAKKRAELDQSLAVMLEFFPIQWRQLFLRLVEEGFTETQSLELVKTYIKASCGTTSA